MAAIGRLVARAEAVDDEWLYIHDLETVWLARLRAVAADAAVDAAPDGASAAASGELSGGELEAAIERLVAEADAVSDPHRAIDWLSTLPQATLVALGAGAW